ncbi:hypothetical protein H072_6720 [Dactylellina haptotyla CBS 200.50]|uniref:F-box domain-containing protein n=1 Tax=Dactylellina haptotyla (strain CBS 200.50) TaxID=1284197 RepID=S8AEJ7_DACHA|nr:hypothetical protein H072_6720 [Dactylellina haptotyla CBS 200.50]
MATIEALPVDLKFIILRNLSDLETLLSLILTSRSFNSVYQQYRPAIRKAVLQNEIGQHKREAHFISVFKKHITIHNFFNHDTLDDVITQYVTYVDTDPDAGFGFRAGSLQKKVPFTTEIQWETAQEVHQQIRKQCREFVERELNAREKAHGIWDSVHSTRATASEKRRIMGALYRLYIVLLLCREYRYFDSGPVEVLYEHMGSIFDIWGFWNFMDVRLVKDFYWEQLFPVMEQFKVYASMRGGSSRFAFARVMAAQYPGNIQQWMSDADGGHACMEDHGAWDGWHWFFQQLCSRQYVERDDGGKDEIAGPLISWLDLFANYLNGSLWSIDPSEIPAENEQNRLTFREYWPRTPPSRICRPEHKAYGFDEKNGVKSWVRPFSWRDTPEFRVCIWDEQRLERWGYVFPEFETVEDTFGAMETGETKDFEQLEMKWVFTVGGDKVVEVDKEKYSWFS